MLSKASHHWSAGYNALFHRSSYKGLDPSAAHVLMSFCGAGAKLKDASVIGYIVQCDPTLHNRYHFWIPASDSVFSRTSVYMNENGAYRFSDFMMITSRITSAN